jgi:type IV secretion system protein TrbE
MSAQVHGQVLFAPGMSKAQRSAALIAREGYPMAEFITWLLALEERYVLCKDGSLMACFEVEGLDIDSAHAHELNQARTQLIYTLEQLQELPLVMSWQVRRRRTTRYPDREFPEIVSQAIDEELKHSFQSSPQFINRVHLCLTMQPAASSQRLLERLQGAQAREGGAWAAVKALFDSAANALQGQTEFPYRNEDEVATALEEFKKVVDLVLASTSGLGIRQLSGDALGGFLELCSSPTSEFDCASALPAMDCYMDTTMPVADIDNSMRDELHFEHNGRQAWASCYSLNLRKRDELSFDMFDKLLAAPFEFTMAHVFRFLARSKGERAVAEVETYHSNRRFPLKSYILAAFRQGDMSGVEVNQARQEATDEARALKDRINVGQVGVGLYYGVVMVQAQTAQDCRRDAEECEEILQQARLLPRLEKLHKFSSFAATVAGSHDEVARWQRIATENFADLTPLRSVSSGSYLNNWLSESLGAPAHALLVLPTMHRTPLYFTGYVGDVGHTLIIGPTGTGKTTVAVLAWTAFRQYPGARVIVFDKNYSCRPSIMVQGGSYIDLNPEKVSTGETRMSPLAALMQNGDDTHLLFLSSWIELLAKVKGYDASAEDMLDLERALRSTLAVGQADPSLLRLSTVVSQIRKDSGLHMALLPWCEGQVLGSYFDNPRDDLDLHSLVGVEMGAILTSEDLAAPFMKYAFYRISAQLRNMGASQDRPIPTLIYIPETWYFLRQPSFAAELEEWLVTLRKLGAAVWFDTQSPDKLVQSPVFAAFRDNIATHIFTPNGKALSVSLSQLYRDALALSDQEIQYIASGVPKQDYYLLQGRLSRRIKLRLPATVMACIRSDQKAQILLERLVGQPDWIERYLKELTHE